VPERPETNDGPIGVFDSGIGGLTVLKEIARALPAEKTIYLGDTARVPYGGKSKETVVRYSREVAGFLAGFDVKMLVVACNTASAFAVDALAAELPVPVVGVIEPGARAAARATATGKVAVTGTEGTIRSGAYTRAIKAASESVEIFTAACPLFVPLVEEGWTDDEVTRLVAERYLGGLRDAGVDTVVLGCTHYPLLKKTISTVMGPGVTLIDSAEATASEGARVLAEKGLARPGATEQTPDRRFFVTDSPERFVKVGGVFFGPGLERAELAEVECWM